MFTLIKRLQLLIWMSRTTVPLIRLWYAYPSFPSYYYPRNSQIYLIIAFYFFLKGEETAAHMLPMSDLRQRLPNARKNISVGNFFFKNSISPEVLMLFSFLFIHSITITFIEQLLCGVSTFWRLFIRKKKKWSTDTSYKVDEPWKYYDKWRKTDTKGHVLYDSVCTKCPE